METRCVRLGVVLVMVLACAEVGLTARAQAQAGRVGIGPHVGMNFDRTDAFLGVEARIDLARLGTTALLQINPSASYYFADNVELLNFSLNIPFEFVIRDSVLRPIAGAGIGLYYIDYDVDSDIDLMLNLIGGFAFDLRDVVPFIQLRAAIGNGSVAELMGGLLFVL